MINEFGLQGQKRNGSFPIITASALSVRTGSPLPPLKLAAHTSADKAPDRGKVNYLHPKLVRTGTAEFAMAEELCSYGLLLCWSALA